MKTELLAPAITKAASKQTYYTIRFLVDHHRVSDAYRAYAYFRWVDDWLDCNASDKPQRLAFIKQQEALIECCYRHQSVNSLADEEQMLADLISSDREVESGLRSYIQHMIAVMAFDAHRRGHLVSQRELTDYSHHLAVAVTDALHYFIGHDSSSPHGESRYLAASAAHIVHMLRDTAEDVEAGYFNIPREWVEFYDLDPCNFNAEPYREWVRHRVQLARSYFESGKKYLRQVSSLRCRIAGFAYLARFEVILRTIERDSYRLRRDYSKVNRLGPALPGQGNL